MFKQILVLVCCFVVFGIGCAMAQEEVGPPPVMQSAPSEMVVVPSGGQPVYLVPGQVGLYFTGGTWYRFYGRAWYQSSVFGGPWISVVMPPTFVSAIPPDYILSLPPGYYRIPYGSFHRHWRAWGPGYWNNHGWYTSHVRNRWEHHSRPGYDRYRNHSGWDRGHGEQGRGPDRGHDRGHVGPDRGPDRGHDKGRVGPDRGPDRGHDKGPDRGHDKGPDRGQDKGR
jgi:hypothetical protein